MDAKTDLKDSGFTETEPSNPKKTFREKLRERGFFRPYFAISVLAFLFGLAIYLLSRFCKPFAEFWARNPSAWIRCLLAKCSGILHFSIAECVILSLPILVGGYFFFSNRSMKRDESVANFYRWILPMISVLLVILFLFFTAFGPCYFRNSLMENLGLEQAEINADTLYDTAVIICKEILSLKDEITFRFDGESIMPYDFNELVTRINDAYDDYANEVPYLWHFRSKAKPLASSDVFTYTHISGVYTFMTGEVNINLNYPDFVRPFTVAHEFSHQRGIAREEEANFVAYLVCIGSKDPYIRYSGYLNMLQYVTDSLWLADRDKYRALEAEYLQGEINGEFRAFSEFFRKYHNSAASAVTSAVNDAFLSSQGEAEGVNSYGLAVDLAIAYYQKKTGSD